MAAAIVEQRLAFIRACEGLKDVLRSGRAASGKQESTAEHTWRLCLMAAVFAPQHLSFERMMKIALIHDLGEIAEGDVPAIEQREDDGRDAREREAFQALASHLPDDQRDEFCALYDDYATAGSAEARFVKGIDKLETMLQHTQGKNADDFDYMWNLGYGRKWTDDDPVLKEIRALVDEATRVCADKRAPWPDDA